MVIPGPIDGCISRPGIIAKSCLPLGEGTGHDAVEIIATGVGTIVQVVPSVESERLANRTEGIEGEIVNCPKVCAYKK